MPRKSGTKTAAKATRRSGSLFTSPHDAAIMRDARGTTLAQDAKTGMWIVRNAAGKIVGKAKSQSAGRRLRYKTEADQGLKVSATVLKRANAKRDKAKSATKTTTTPKRAGTARKRAGVKRSSTKK